MSDEPKAGGEGGGVVAEPKPSAQKAEAGKAEPTLEEQLAASRAENEAHRKTQKEQQSKVEEANRILEAERARSANQPPPTTAPGPDPHDAEVAAAEEAVRQYPNDPGYRAALRQSIAERNYARQQQAVSQNRPRFDAMPEKHRQRAWEIWWNSGGTVSPDTALAAAKGEKFNDEEAEKLRKENEELKKDKEAREAGRVSLGARPVVSSAPSTTGLARQVKMSEYASFMDNPSISNDEKRAWLRDEKAGKLVQVPD